MPTKNISILSTKTLRSYSSTDTTSTESDDSSSSSDGSLEDVGCLNKYRLPILIILVILLLIALGLFIYAIIGGFYIYNYSWLSSMGLIGKAPDYWKSFLNNRIYTTFKIYPFSIINIKDVLKGKKPKLKEGPLIVYRLKTRKINVNYDREEDTLTFEEKFENIFLQSISDNDQFTKILPVNVPMWLLLHHALDFYGNKAPTELFELLKDPEEVFGKDASVTKPCTVYNLMFGYNSFCAYKGNVSEICKKFRILVEISNNTMFKITRYNRLEFGMLSYLLPAYHAVPTVQLGLKNIEMAGHITKLDGKSFITSWDNGSRQSTCNKIRGMVHYFTGSGRGLNGFQVWVNDICRPVTFQYKQKTSDDIHAEFEMSQDTLINSIEPNQCYCRNNPRNMQYWRNCYDGVMGLYDCIGSPLFLSYPHLLGASGVYTSRIEGLVPNKKKHTSRIIMYKKNGTFLEFSIKYQYNVPIFAVKEIPILANVSWALVPILWVEQRILVNDEEMESFVKTSLYTHAYNKDMIPVNNFRFGTLAISSLVIVVCIVLIIVILLKPKPLPREYSYDSDISGK
ncbi:sensory neuron membrane protein 2-like isoform X2 [Anthonomus grandis grandis]|uniref:sensory neuron membrane protein 2-like isoform X2 n=1 Tax=Anthonomus grandis grandis TaxID=2921223 RepID=UPI002166938D|nr:sensory neuron membrane protein 2-like isoform X2 [Anthonomus grandis grandis]